MDPPDTGTMLLAPGRTTRHICNPPGTPSATRYLDYPLWRARTHDVSGGLWRCVCGQHWHGVDMHWEPVSDRQARRLIKRAT